MVLQERQWFLLDVDTHLVYKRDYKHQAKRLKIPQILLQALVIGATFITGSIYPGTCFILPRYWGTL